MDQINYKVNVEGFSYFLKDSGESSNAPDWSHALDKTEDLAAYQLLTQLIDDGTAVKLNNKILISHKEISDLPDDERNLLDLPDQFPFDIEVSALGSLADSNFKYEHKFLSGGSQSFINPKRIGALLQITSNREYIFNGNQFRILEAIEAFNKSDNNDSTTNYLSFGEIKGLMGNVGFVLDSYLHSQNVVTPKNICLRLNPLEDGFVEVIPLFCEESENADGITYNKNILDTEQTSAFHKKFRKLKEKSVYSIPDGPIVVLNDKQREGLNQIKSNSRVSKEDEIILNSPQSFFDCDVIDFDKPVLEGNELLTWSSRVLGVGEYKYKAIPFIRQSKESWLPPESGGIKLDEESIDIPREDRKPLQDEILEAIKNKHPYVDYKDHKIPAKPEVISAIDDLIEADPDPNTKTSKKVKPEEKNNAAAKVLIIIDNIEKDEYRVGKKKREGDIQVAIPLKQDKTFLGHQEFGVKWLQNCWKNGYNGCLLADDMGLGKTLQALSFISWIENIKKTKDKKVLIIAPVVLLENWKNEYSKFMQPVLGSFLELHDKGLKNLKTSDLTKALHCAGNIDIKIKGEAEKIIKNGGFLLDLKELSKHQVVLTTYETVRDYQVSLSLVSWDVVTLDEGQKIKTPNAMVTSAIKALKYDFGLVLTGTPIENSWVDLWSIIDFVQPGHLKSLKEFIKKYQTPLKKEDTDRESLGNDLKEKVDPLFLRRMKEDNLEGLPNKIIKKHSSEQMPEAQLNRYLEIIRKAKSSSASEDGKKTHILSTIRYLSEVSLHPDLPYLSDYAFADKSDDEIINSSSKLITTFKLISEIKKSAEKVIIFLVSRKMQRVVKRLIDNKFKMSTHIINGEVKGSERQGLIDGFQDTNGFNVIILSPEAAGTGLNITEANHVIHLSRTWNPAKEDQASDRVYRIGQKKDVFIHIPMCVHNSFDNEERNGTFDQKLDRLLDEKRDLHKRILFPADMKDSDLQGLGEESIDIDIDVDVDDCDEIEIADVDNLSPSNFERFIALLYRSPGNGKKYSTTVTGGTGDQGADVVCLPHGSHGNSIIIQCKHSTNINKPQGNTGVQEILGAKGIYEKKHSTVCNLIVATNTVGFTKNAEEIAQENKVELVNRDKIKRLLKGNRISLTDLRI